MFQAHVLNLLIGNKASNVSGKAVKLGGYQWKVEEDNVRKWKLWVRFHLTKIIFNLVSMKYIGSIPAEKGFPGSADSFHYLLLDCIYNCSLRWSAICHVVTLEIINKGFFSFSNFALEQDPANHAHFMQKVCQKSKRY